jgi:hypothetical protein
VDAKMKIDKSTFLWIVIAILFVLVIYVVFFQGSTSSAETLSPTAGQAAQAYSGMVGGC